MDTCKQPEIYIDRSNCILPGDSQTPLNLSLAIATIPMQQWNQTYKVETALQKGTIFPELDLPFMGKGGNR